MTSIYNTRIHCEKLHEMSYIDSWVDFRKRIAFQILFETLFRINVITFKQCCEYAKPIIVAEQVLLGADSNKPGVIE